MKYLLIGISTRALAESAVKAGKDITAIDYFGDADQESICTNISLKREYNAPLQFIASLFLKAAGDIRADYLVYESPIENYPSLIGKFAQKYTILGNDAQTVRRVRNWKALSAFCKKVNVSYPETFDGLHYIAKPKKSGGGIGIQPLRHYLVQTFVRGDSYSASFLGNGEKCEVISVNEQLIGRREFGARKLWYCGSITPVSIEEDVRGICAELTHSFNLKGSCGIDFLIKNGLYLLEVNPRPQATLEIVERAFNTNVFLLHERAVSGVVDRIGNPTRTWGKAILYAERDVTMPDTTEWFHHGWVKDIPHPSERIMKSEPICTIIADGSDRDDCFQHLIIRSSFLRKKYKI